jgi:hypothetical protein
MCPAGGPAELSLHLESCCAGIQQRGHSHGLATCMGLWWRQCRTRRALTTCCRLRCRFSVMASARAVSRSSASCLTASLAALQGCSKSNQHPTGTYHVVQQVWDARATAVKRLVQTHDVQRAICSVCVAIINHAPEQACVCCSCPYTLKLRTPVAACIPQECTTSCLNSMCSRCVCVHVHYRSKHARSHRFRVHTTLPVSCQPSQSIAAITHSMHYYTCQVWKAKRDCTGKAEAGSSIT